jgi:hypothetical protein
MEALMKALNIEPTPPTKYSQTHRLYDLYWRKRIDLENMKYWSLPNNGRGVLKDFDDFQKSCNIGYDVIGRENMKEEWYKLAEYFGVPVHGLYWFFLDTPKWLKNCETKCYFLTDKLSSMLHGIPLNLSRYVDNTEYMIELQKMYEVTDSVQITDFSCVMVDPLTGRVHSIEMLSVNMLDNDYIANEDPIKYVLSRQYRFYYLGLFSYGSYDDNLYDDSVMLKNNTSRKISSSIYGKLSVEEKYRLLRQTIIDAIAPKPNSITKPVVFTRSPYIDLIDLYYDPSVIIGYPIEFYRPTFDIRTYDYKPLAADCPEYVHFVKIGLIKRDQLIEFIDQALVNRGYDYAATFVRPLLKLSKINHRYFIYFLSKIHQLQIDPDTKESAINDYCETVLLNVPAITHEHSDIFGLLNEFNVFIATSTDDFFETK